MTDSNKSNDSGEERREYFRLEDDVAMRYRFLEIDEIDPLIQHIRSAGADPFMSAASFAETSRQLRRLLPGIREQSSVLAQFLGALDNKLNTLSQLFVQADFKEHDFITQQVSLSAGGIGFFCEHPLAFDHMYELKIVLLSSNIGICAIGRTVQCAQKPDLANDKPFYVAFEFVHIRESDRDLIVRHLLAKQTEQRQIERSNDKEPNLSSVE